MLLMSAPIVVRISGAPVACAEGVKDTWREIATWIGENLATRFGEKVQVAYLDLFDPACPPLPPNAQLPLVYIDDEIFSSGGKLNGPAIRRRIEALISSADGNN